MQLALFLGCKIPYFLNHYDTATRVVLGTLGVRLVDMEFNCCGYPIRHLHAPAYLLASARNLALAEKRGLDITTPCKCCYGSLKKAEHALREDEDLRGRINAELAPEGLHYDGRTGVKHMLSVLYHDVGVAAIKERVRAPFRDLRIAAHYGCHALRPSDIVQFDDPVAPTLFETLVEATGAESVSWPARLECCGNPVWEKSSELSMALTRKKVYDAANAGGQFLCVACTYCQMQFDTAARVSLSSGNGEPDLTSLLYPQLLGLSLGIEPELLGINGNGSDPLGSQRRRILTHLS